jgi:hypothetical protein
MPKVLGIAIGLVYTLTAVTVIDSVARLIG